MVEVKPKPASAAAPLKKQVSPAAERALAEAAARRAARDRTTAPRPPESGGSRNLDPVRYGDWEINGIATDF
jgi:hypothetical protein